MGTFSKEDFKGHWSAAAENVKKRSYLFIDESNSGSWTWVEFDGDSKVESGTVTFDRSLPPRATLVGSSTYTTKLSIAELSDGSNGLSDSAGHLLRETSCVAIFDIIQDTGGALSKNLQFKKAFPETFKVSADRVEVPTDATLLVRYDLPTDLGYKFKSGESWLHWSSFTSTPQVQLVRINDYSVVVFDKAPATAGDTYTFNLVATGPAGDTDIDPIVVIKSPPG